MQAKEEGKESADAVEPVTRTVSKTSEEWAIQNDNKPLWTKSPRDVSASAPCACEQACFVPAVPAVLLVDGPLAMSAVSAVLGLPISHLCLHAVIWVCLALCKFSACLPTHHPGTCFALSSSSCMILAALPSGE